MNIKYMSENAISYLIEKCKSTFALITHKHTASEVGADVQGSASKALSNAKTYTDGQIEIVSGNLSTHTGNNTIHITSAERTKWNSKVDQTALDSLSNTVSGKANESHSHAISNVTNLQSSLNAKASQTSLDGHTGNTTVHITSTERTNWNKAKTHADSTHVTGVKGNAESSYRTGNVNITKANIGLGNVDNTSDANKPVSTAQQEAMDSLFAQAKKYADDKDALLLNNSSTAVDSIMELATVMAENEDVVDALEQAIGTKAKASDLTSHTSNKSNPHGVTKSQVGLGNVENKSSATIRSEITKSNVTTALGYTPYAQTEVDSLLDVKVDKVSGKGLSTNDYTTAEKTKLSGIAEGAEVNQNAFGKVTVGSSTITADAEIDTLTMVAGTGISLTADTSADKVTITNSGVRSVSTGSTNGTISVNTDGESVEVAVKGLGSAAYTESSAYAKKSHGTHVTWSTTSPKMNGTATVGSETKVARGDHVHPTDTSRASQTDLDALEAVVDGKASKTHSHAISDVTDLQTTLDGKSNVGHNHLYYGVCSTAADTVAKTVTVDNFSLVTGAMVIVKFSNANSASSPTLNVNNTGAKPICRYGTTAASTSTSTTGWRAGAVQIFIYDGTSWIRDFWENTTYSNAGLGIGYATCSTAKSTVAKTATLSSYSLTTGGIVSVKFTNAVPASATLNINSKGAKNIYFRGSAITANIIKAGDIATFVYSSQYHLISIDRWQNDIDSKQATITGAATTITGSNLTASRALISNSSGKVAVSDVTSTELGYLDGVTSNIQAQIDSKSASTHTHNYAGSSSAGGAATSANKVNTNLVVKLNSGTTEGTNMYTFNGSTAKTVNITPSSIGASASGHTHDDRYYTETEIDSKLAGKSDSGHTHSYAGSSSAGGVATSAAKLATARKIGDTTFDGTADISLEKIIGRGYCSSSSNTKKGKYQKFARINVSDAAWSGCFGTFNVKDAESDKIHGQLNFHVRSNSTIAATSVNLTWTNVTTDYESSVVAVKVSDGIYDLYYQSLQDHEIVSFRLIDCINRNKITLYESRGWVDSVDIAETSSLSGNVLCANKLNTNAGSATQPVYFSGGIPVACTNTLGKSVPSNAVFTDAKVTQTVRTTDGEFPILLRGTSAGTSTTTTGTTFGTKMTANPSTGSITVTSLNIGEATMTYDSSVGAIVFNFS